MLGFADFVSVVFGFLKDTFLFYICCFQYEFHFKK